MTAFMEGQRNPCGGIAGANTKCDATVTLTDQQVKPASALKEGDKIVFWVPESRFGFYAKSGAAESQQFKVVSE